MLEKSAQNKSLRELVFIADEIFKHFTVQKGFE